MFGVATSYSLGEDTITRDVMDRQTTDRLWYENNIPYFSNEKAGITTTKNLYGRQRVEFAIILLHAVNNKTTTTNFRS